MDECSAYGILKEECCHVVTALGASVSDRDSLRSSKSRIDEILQRLIRGIGRNDEVVVGRDDLANCLECISTGHRDI